MPRKDYRNTIIFWRPCKFLLEYHRLDLRPIYYIFTAYTLKCGGNKKAHDMVFIKDASNFIKNTNHQTLLHKKQIMTKFQCEHSLTKKTIEDTWIFTQIHHHEICLTCPTRNNYICKLLKLFYFIYSFFCWEDNLYK